MSELPHRAAVSALRRAAALAAALVLAVVTVFGYAAPASATPGLTPSQVQSQQWWISKLNLQKAWAITKGKDVTVAVFDSGLKPDFGDLRGAVVNGFAPLGSGNGEPDTDPAVHGTLMADEIAGRGTGIGLLGIAPQAKVMPVVIPLNGSGTGNTDDATIKALDRLVAMTHPPQVVNMSYGGPRACPADLAGAVARAVRKGLILVSSSGNSGDTIAQSPADCPGVVSVGAVDENGGPWSDSTHNSYVALAGPGVHMIGYDAEAASGLGYADGTSDASAVVSGVFALMRAEFPTMPSRTLVAKVLYTAHQFIGAKHTRNQEMGYGVALPYAALTAHVPADAPNPIYDAVPAAGHSSTPPPTQPRTAPGTSAPSEPSTGLLGSGSSGGGGTNVGLIAAVVAAVVLVLAIVVFLMLRARQPARR